jgi:hypothetical protein
MCPRTLCLNLPAADRMNTSPRAAVGGPPEPSPRRVDARPERAADRTAPPIVGSVRRYPLVLCVAGLLLAGCSSATDDSAAGSSSTTAVRTGTGSGSGTTVPGTAAEHSDPTSTGSRTSGSATPRPSLAGDGVVSRAAFSSSGRTWPLTVTEGTLFCESSTQIIFTTHDGDAYGVNAAAQGTGEWDDINTIRATVHGSPADLGDLIEAGQQLC